MQTSTSYKPDLKKFGEQRARTSWQGPKSSQNGFRRTPTGQGSPAANKQQCSSCGELGKRLRKLEERIRTLSNKHVRLPSATGSWQTVCREKVAPKSRQRPTTSHQDRTGVKPLNNQERDTILRKHDLLNPSSTNQARRVGSVPNVSSAGTSGESMTPLLKTASLSRILPSRRTSPRRSSRRSDATTSAKKSSGPDAACATAPRTAKAAAATVQSGSVIEALATTPKDLKRRPGYKSDRDSPTIKRVTWEARRAPDDAADKPVYATNTSKRGPARKVPLGERRRQRKAFVDVDDNLYWYLVLEFALVPRTSDILRQMKAKAKQFLNLHDLNDISLKDQYTMVIGTISRAMLVPEQEMKLRQELKSDAAIEEMGKHAKLVKRGMIGRAFGGLGKPFSLPEAIK
ncbi:hypothetical protein 2 [Sanxia water strider virus 14]|uniref:hypothetical protein 2 n=1 Tax=Sanxia water strider virus 14 TaxID=1923398 RepID=UPI000909D0C7|nr:hypothetical protein 2 [Sanxia water strider virus 14]APG76421.1 hypothetical protein 2 [Sanxia water strider virus 14]